MSESTSDPLLDVHEHPIWNVPLEQAPLAFLDLEMTGLQAAKDHICELAILRVRGHELLEEWHTLVRPPCGVGESKSIHGIVDEMLQDAPTFASIAARVDASLRGSILIGHAVQHDTEFLSVELERVGGAPRWIGSLDTLPLARRCLPERSFALSSLTRSLGITHSQVHRAASDAQAVRELFWRLVSRLQAQTPRELHELVTTTGFVSPRLWQQLEECARVGAVVKLHYRPLRKGAVVLEMKITALHREPPIARIEGYSLPDRSRRELRVDRILAIE